MNQGYDINGIWSVVNSDRTESSLFSTQKIRRWKTQMSQTNTWSQIDCSSLQVKNGHMKKRTRKD